MPRPLRTLVGLVALAALASACSGGGGNDAASRSTTSTSNPSRANVDKTLVLGQLAPRTGELASINKSLTAPVQIAVAEINAAGGFDGKPVGLAVADDASGGNLPLAGSSLHTLRTTNRADAIIGPSASGTALDLLDVVKDTRTLMCSGSNSAPELSSTDSGGYYFRTSPPDRLQAVALARLALEEGRKKPVVVVRDDDYGDAFARALLPELRRGGAQPGPVIRYDPRATDLSGAAKRAAAQRPDSVIAIALVDDGARLVDALIAAGLPPAQTPLYTADGMQSLQFATKVNPANRGAVSGIRGTAPAAAPATPESAFTLALRRAGAEPIFSAYYYDCTILTALAARQAKSDDPVKMKSAFARSLRGSNDCSSYAQCVQLLDAGKTIHYRGASSRFDRWAGFEPGDGIYDRWSYGSGGSVVTAPPASQIHVP